MLHLRKYSITLLLGFLFSSFQNIDQETTDFYGSLKQYDICGLWNQDKIIVEDGNETYDRPEPLGYFGDDYYRFYIHFISVIQNKDNPYQYFVYGKTRLKKNICAFQGTITVTESKLFRDSDAPGFKQGYIMARFDFYEDSGQKGSGKLYGTCLTNFIIDKDNKLRYDALMAVADGFSNNAFKGRWQAYQSKENKKCNWGDFRIPESEKLDGGAGAFMPSKEYIQNGWENYEKVMTGTSESPEAKKAFENENQKWWK